MHQTGEYRDPAQRRRGAGAPGLLGVHHACRSHGSSFGAVEAMWQSLPPGVGRQSNSSLTANQGSSKPLRFAHQSGQGQVQNCTSLLPPVQLVFLTLCWCGLVSGDGKTRDTVRWEPLEALEGTVGCEIRESRTKRNHGCNHTAC